RADCAPGAAAAAPPSDYSPPPLSSPPALPPPPVPPVASKVTGTKVSLFAFFTPWAPKVIQPQVTRVQSTVTVLPLRSFAVKRGPGTFSESRNDPLLENVAWASPSVDDPG